MNPYSSLRRLSLGFLLLAGAAAFASEEGFNYLFTLSDFTGPVPFLGARVRLDVPRNEAYVEQGNSVRVFGPSGMEVHSFMLDPTLGSFSDLAVDEDGNIDLLGYKPGSSEGAGFFLLRCDYRGHPVDKILPTGVPSGMENFAPEVVILSGGRYYLASPSRMAVLVLDRTGAVQASADLAELAGLDPEKRAETVFGGFAVDPEGRLVYSLPTDFSVRIASLDGSYRRRIGEAGNRPGQFGIVGAVTTDADGNLFVADRLRSTVLVFDRDQRFVTEFGRYGDAASDIVIPADLAVSAGRLFVSQMRNRGVTVFARGSGAGEEAPPKTRLQMPGARHDNG